MFAFSSFSIADTVNENLQNVTANEANQRIDINQADVKTFTSLKGIGTKKAAAIVEYRDSNGKFTSVDELLNVNGIGQKVLAMNKEKLTI